MPNLHEVREETIQAMCPGYTLTARNIIVTTDEFISTCLAIFTQAWNCMVCPDYGQRWSCPPYKMSSLDFWRRHKQIWLWGYVLTPLPDTSLSSLISSSKVEKSRLLDFLLELEAENPGSLAVAPDCCRLCTQCTRPAKKPCQHPDKMRYAMASMGCDTAKTSELYLKKPMPPVEHGKAPE